MKRKIFAISVLMTAFFTVIPGTGFSQDEKAPAPAASQDEKAPAPDTGASEDQKTAAPDTGASEDQKTAAPDAGTSEDQKATVPETGTSQDEKAPTSGTSSPEGKVMVPTGPSTGEKAEAPELTEYTIVRHDTLWDISKRFLKNPFKWPTIWKQNPYIKNPDLIYPGNIVRISPDGHVEIVKAPPPPPKELPTVVLEGQKENVVVLQPPAPAAKEGEAKNAATAAAKAAAEAAKPKVPVLASESMPRKGFISRRELDAAGVIVEPKEKEDRLYFAKDDKVIVSFKDKEYKKGDRFSIIQEGKKIYHPATGSYMGKLVESLGTLTITDANTPAEALIDRSFKEITRGASLVPFKETPREVEITRNESEISGYIIAAINDESHEFGEGNIVYIDKGGKDGLANGNVMRIYRERKRISDPVKGGYITPPPFDLGTVVVIDAGEKTSSAIIVRSTGAINAGDQVATVPAAKEASSK